MQQDSQYRIDIPGEKDFPMLGDIWAASVRATHDFLSEADFLFYEQLVRGNELFRQVSMACVRDREGQILGFSGCSASELELLFIHPDQRGKGIGKLLLLHAIDQNGIRQVTVNEANRQALDFYLHHGFHVQSRSPRDGMDKPYPLLHLAR